MNHNKMKGLLKGLRYIAQIFEPEGKEQEMQIGYPTDVKHVAHIGWDGPSVNPPGWTKDFQSAPLTSLETHGLAVDIAPTRFPSHDFNEEDTPDLRPRRPSRRKSTPDSQAPLEVPPGDLPKPSRRHAPARAASADATYSDHPSSTSPAGSVSRQNRSNDTSPLGSPANNNNQGDRCPPRQARRHAKIKEARNGREPPTTTVPGAEQPPPLPRQSHRKKNPSSRGSYGDGGSTRLKAVAEAGMLDAARTGGNNCEGGTGDF